MMSATWFSLCLLSLVLGKVLALENVDLKLVLASVVFRHGDRSPIHSFPTDNYTESDWPQGYGQLSIVGMQQQQALGELLKTRYVGSGNCTGLICPQYRRVQVTIRSTDVDRTLMSAATQLSSLFYPEESDRFNSTILWQPIPVHTTINDTLLRPLDNCPAYDKLLEKSQQSPEYKKMEAKYKEFFENLTGETDMTVNLSSIWMIQDTVKIEYDSPDHSPPSWATDAIRAKLQTISDYTMSFMFNSTQKRRFSAGNWASKILEDMKGKANPNGNKTLEDMNLFLYSAHDTTVAAMTSGLGVSNSHQPGYATAFAVELFSGSDGKHYVQMFRRNGPDSDSFDLLNATYCKDHTLCTLTEFEEYAKTIILSDFEKECRRQCDSPTDSPTDSPVPSNTELKDQNQLLRTTVIVLGSVLAVTLLIAIMLTVIVISVCRKKNANAHRLYSALHAES